MQTRSLLKTFGSKWHHPSLTSIACLGWPATDLVIIMLKTSNTITKYIRDKESVFLIPLNLPKNPVEVLSHCLITLGINLI